MTTTPEQRPTHSAHASTPAEQRRVLAASFLGTTVEWYDFFIYGAAAALVFGPQFFPSLSATAGTLAAFSTFAVGFVARPLGGLIAGHLGDRRGRKSVLVASLLAMGAATVLIGLLPTYEQVGIWAPIGLVVLRLVQGLGVGAEWGGAVLMAVEHAPPRRRAFYGSFPQMGVPAGIVLSSVAFLVLNAAVSPDQFASWGWRIPFLLSAVLIVIGLLVRLSIHESPLFAEAAASRGRQNRRPLVQVVVQHPRELLVGTGATVAATALGYLVLVYMLAYGTTALKLPRSTMLWLTLVAAVVWLVAIAGSALLADRIGRRRVFVIGASLAAAWAFPFFLLVDSTHTAAMVVAFVVAALAIAAMAGPQAALIAEMFPVAVRYSGSSIAYQAGSVLGGGLAPIIATALYNSTASSTSVALYAMATALVSLVAVVFLPAASRPDTP
ncbi:MFS transporter [Pseudonocardia sp. WMMC193]|uniref:MFS transporter n=1 Tax=Pseudonocardia sp. WMMC193 TaxID=2911965 RepID=UPI001F40815B|nr:MFS transporter [Pseudonocardia sp. WMMC193]MCF7547477.1 MHS family MFS transporter [Pseudonocardia sp. WMMC193]